MRSMHGSFLQPILVISILISGSWLTASAQQQPSTQRGSPTVQEAEKFIRDAEAKLNDLSVKASRAAWVQANFITVDTETMAAEANEQLIAATTELAKASRRYERLKLPPELARKIKLLKLALTAPAPSDPKELQELTRIAVSLESEYGKGKYCPKRRTARGGPQEPDDDACLDITEIERIMSNSRDANELLDVWTGWRTISPPMRKRYTRFVELSNKGAREMGFADVGTMWRSNYDMPPDDFSKELERLWQQVKPIYESLHAYVRTKLGEHYGTKLVSRDGMIPAHLLGNPWAQEWGHIYPLVAPAEGGQSIDLTARLKAKKVDARGMVKFGENFFSSLGFAPLPETFWERSLFLKPRDREVVCHASAWDIDNKDDLRLKMCIQIRDEDFVTVHHELGHNYYQRAYKNQPYLFQGSANDGFHEALGDAVALSTTPEYLKQIGLVDEVPPPSEDIGLLLRDGLDKIAFLPFGLLIDQWRWKVFSGEVTPANYNKAWWELRNRYQGVAAPVPRTEEHFDPGAKYHIPGNTPYTRYFLARILQFQFHRAMCRQAGLKGPLHRCSIYGNKQVGARLNRMMEMGISRPWPDALEALTGERRIDAGALLEYFAPLKQWLDQQNRKANARVGWDMPKEAD